MDVAQAAPRTVILAEDEMSMYLQATTQSAWAPRGQTPRVRVAPSRVKTNFYGTLNLCTGQELAMRAEHLNSETTAQYITYVLETYPDVPILWFWDHAPWHRGKAVAQVLAANPRLEIVWYPVASPELNPQEHVWKATRRAISHNHEQAELKSLADQVESYLNGNTFASSFLDDYAYNAVRPMFI